MTTPAHGVSQPTTPSPPGLGPAFHRFWAGSLLSNLADGIMLTALPMVAAMLTNDPILVSGLMVARFLPWLLCGLIAGVVVDRVNRATLMVAANLVRGGAIAVLAVLVATGTASIWVLYAVMFTVMLCEVFYDLSGRAALPDLVPADGLDRANGRLVGGKTVTEDFGGAPLAGFLFVVATALPLAVNAGAYVLGALVLLGLPLAVRRPESGEPAPRTSGGAASGAVRAVLTEIRAGLGFVFGDRALRSPVLFGVVVNMAFMAQAGVLVLLVQEHFGVPEALYGVFLASSAVGALLGSALVGKVAAKLGRFRTELVSFGAMGLCCLAFGLAPSAYLAALAWMLLGTAMTVSNVVMIGSAQMIVPGDRLGRVMSVIQVLGFGLAPVGALLGGLLGRVELHYVPVAAGTVLLVSLVLAVPGLRALTARADEAEAAVVAAAREGA
ncbi:MFS transporter [Nocardiopsis sp. CNT312]|uniref:MFS transporter n=1 Tax=Nocardiopsis sp. CNT312 TaxID=1137268 RepID=UPI0004B766EC|nr:MFS transporter [Nocardiopsis sp. CNT312]